MQAGVARPVAIGIGLAVVAAVGFLFVWGTGAGKTTDTPTGFTDVVDATGLQEMVELSHLGILTSTNYLGQKVYLVRATLKNVSDKPIRNIDLKMTFFDYDKKKIQDETRNAFGPKQSPLEPGTEYRAEVAFENPPRNWNYHVPDTTVVKASY